MGINPEFSFSRLPSRHRAFALAFNLVTAMPRCGSIQNLRLYQIECHA
jgi:hypothetical protein